MKNYKFNNLKYNYDYFAFDHTDEIRINRHLFATTEELHGHDYYEIEYITQGSGVQIINGLSYTVEAGTIIVLSPTDTHSYYSLKDMKVSNVCFTTTDKIKHVFDFSKVTVTKLDAFFKVEVEQLLDLLETEMLAQKPQRYESMWQILDLILLAISRSQSDPIYTDPTWGKILLYIPQNIQNISLEEVSKIMGVSVSYFCRAFKKKFAVTFHQYITNVKMQMAKELLQNSDEVMSDISKKIGYSSAGTFFRKFKKYTGMTPKEYKRMCKNRDGNIG